MPLYEKDRKKIKILICISLDDEFLRSFLLLVPLLFCVYMCSSRLFFYCSLDFVGFLLLVLGFWMGLGIFNTEIFQSKYD